MKGYRSIIIIFMLIAGSAIDVSAQRAARSASARAAYGDAYESVWQPQKRKTKKKNQRQKLKAHKNKQLKQAKTMKEKSPVYRKRSPWAG